MNDRTDPSNCDRKVTWLPHEYQCPEHFWCSSTDPKHADLHASSVFGLAGDDGSGERGWQCWLTQDQRRDQRPRIQVEGRSADGSGLVRRADLDVEDAESLFLASSTRESRLYLEIVLALATGRHTPGGLWPTSPSPRPTLSVVR